METQPGPENFTRLNNQSAGLNEFEISHYLDELNRETIIIMIPSIIYLIILGLVGFIGNSLVLFVYSRKFSRTPTRIFILSIASFDLITNTVVIPGEIYDLFHLWDFDKVYICKVRLFFNAFTTMVAAMVLVAVAVARYRKICKPFGWQITVTHAKVISVSMAVASLLFSVPYAIINGRQTKPAPRAGINGHECTIDDSYLNTMWPMMNAAFFILLFVVCSTPLVVLYVLIGIKAWRHSKMRESLRGRADSSFDKESSSEMSTRSTKDSKVGLPVIGSKSKSYVRKDSNSSESSRLNHNGPEKKQSSGGDGGGGPSQASISRTPNGDKINLVMVRELTIKLKAVQEEAVKSRPSGKTSVTFKENLLENIPESNNYDDSGSTSSASTDLDAANTFAHHENRPSEGGLEPRTQRSNSDFVKAMQWIGLTYGQTSHDSANNRNAETEQHSEEAHQCKKGSISSSRKPSRDNSFVRKSRKFKGAITDTLTRARKSLKVRETRNDRLSDEIVQEDEAEIIAPEINAVISSIPKREAELTSLNQQDKNTAVTPKKLSVSTTGKSQNDSSRRVSVKDTKNTRGRGMGKTTCMLLIISLIYVLGFLPYLALAFFKSLAPESYKSMDSIGESLYNLFLRSYFLNSAANPIIYNLCDVNFRKECLKLLKLSANLK
ncbi:hypothetical protein Btru_029588 [Bulinus truncatus]|nr:hypothetical protein Btru_029588 [Bulinus truncatus]